MDDDGFATVSAILTGYDGAALRATGCLPEYRRQVAAVAGPALAARMVAEGHALAALPDGSARDAHAREAVFADPDLGPLARSLIQLWYLGQWVPMPPDWVARNGAQREDVAHILSPRSYREGLVWDAIGAHPLGAKPQGFGAWAQEPPAGPEGGS
ncbi:MAG: hypothetical protein R6V26_13750 [Roseovarius sp.]